MKVGMITITNGTNYGNRLQIYALQQVLKRLGHDPFLIENRTLMHGIKYYLKKYLKVIAGYHNEREEYKRECAYRRFDREWISISNYFFDENYLNSTIANHFDAFICGSDQIWNPYFPYLNGGCFANFPGAQLRISYSASFGESEIPPYMSGKYREWLCGMDTISVREESGVSIVKELTGKNASVHIDPTLMLDVADWVKIEEAPNTEINEPYIFKYFLGEIKPDVSAFINDLSCQKDYNVIDVLPNKKHENYYLNPSNFIYLLHHSDFVVTDSFHATVFAILFNKPVRVFDRVDSKLNMASRLDTLLQIFDCKEIRNNLSLSKLKKIVPIDEKILSERRQCAYEYLSNSLDCCGREE